MHLKEKLRIAGIKQSEIAELSGCTEQYVNQVLNKAKSSSRVMSIAAIRLNNETKARPALKTLFESEGAK